MKKCKQCGFVVDDDSLMSCPQCGSNGPWLFPKRNTNQQTQNQMNQHNQMGNQQGNMYNNQMNNMGQQGNMYNNQMNQQMNMQGNGGVQNVGGTAMPLTKKEIKEKKKAQQAQMRAQQAQQGNQMGMNQTAGGMNQANGTGLMEPVMSVFDWLKLMICMSLPIVNIVIIIMAFVNKDTSKTKKNYIIAALIVMAIAVVLSMIASAVVTSMMRSAISSLY